MLGSVLHDIALHRGSFTAQSLGNWPDEDDHWSALVSILHGTTDFETLDHDHLEETHDHRGILRVPKSISRHVSENGGYPSNGRNMCICLYIYILCIILLGNMMVRHLFSNKALSHPFDVEIPCPSKRSRRFFLSSKLRRVSLRRPWSNSQDLAPLESLTTSKVYILHFLNLEIW